VKISNVDKNHDLLGFEEEIIKGINIYINGRRSS